MLLALLTWEQLAILLNGRPIDGAQATSLTQSVCPSSFSSIIQLSPSSLQTLTVLSPPPVTSLLVVDKADLEPPWKARERESYTFYCCLLPLLMILD